MNNEIHPKIFIGIDPGKNGGVAVINEVPDFETTIAFNGDEPIEVRIPKHMNMIIQELVK